MRRMLFTCFALITLGLLAGCHCCHRGGCGSHTHGICDCDMNEDPCHSRAPWARSATTISPKAMPAADLPKN